LEIKINWSLKLGKQLMRDEVAASLQILEHEEVCGKEVGEA